LKFGAGTQALVTPSSQISSPELTIHAGLPQRSVSGLPVVETAAFGWEVFLQTGSCKEGAEIDLGKLFHMGQVEEMPVRLNRANLSAHTFITGSTGSGKSNAVYCLLEKLRSEAPVSFLVIEPAKGEYRGMFPDAAVYGTNPQLTPLLRINPFRFPAGVHILEHLDKLVEIFNVCWPMYAAMPAILKEAIERAYREAGWDLRSSENNYEEKLKTALYPGFIDVVRHVRRILDSSEYSAENKSNYKGALLIRLNSLCNGINGMIFTNDGLPEEALFDRNAIVDLSRAGSTETKSLIMGLLVLKLQEHRMCGESASGLRHVTVLEEAHRLLRRVSPEQSNESANLLGKSVEMLANAIAEMRSYGEGFVIVDQSPGLLDMSVIRNTNTKIILRLPGEEDRVLVGRAAGLSGDQIAELAKLPTGAAAVFQNEWIEPVLCKVDKFSREPLRSRTLIKPGAPFTGVLIGRLKRWLQSRVQTSPKIPGPDPDIASLRDDLLRSDLSVSLKLRLHPLLTENIGFEKNEEVAPLIGEMKKEYEDAGF
jgi:hypothetical protein